MSKQFLSEVNESQTINESFQKEKFEKIKPDLTKYYIMSAVVLISIFSLYFILNQKLTMVDMKGWTLTDAQSWASKNDIQLIVTSVYDLEEVEIVLSQSVEANTKITKNSTINIEVSLGADPDELIEFPTFDEEWTKTEIVSWLKEMQIDDYTFTTEQTSSLESNLFIEYQIEVDVSQFTRSDAITFIVTSNSSSDPVTVVDFSNYSKAQIDEWAEDNNVKIKYTYTYSDSVQSDKVIDQSIDANEEVDQLETVTITISLGEAVKIVDFTSYNQTDAKNWASENSINLTILMTYSNTVAKGVPIYQDIVKNTIVQQGSKLNIIYSLGSQIAIGSYQNKALTDLQTYVETQNGFGAGLSLNVSYQYSNSVSINQIISHNPVNASLPIGKMIDVIVSLGRLVSVPDFNSLLNEPEMINVQIVYNRILELSNSQENPINSRIQMIDVEGDVISITQSIASGTMISNADIVDIVLTY